VLRRRSGGATATAGSDEATAAADQQAKTAGKGKPTPKRSEVERARRQPYTPPPKDKKAANAQQRDRRRAETIRRNEAMKRGEEWAIPARDRGSAKALARDYLDARKFIISEYILFAVFLLVFVIFALGSGKTSGLVLYIELGILAIILIEGLYHGLRVTSLIKQRLPDASTRGIIWYVIKRSLRLRSSRIPPPRVKRGDAI
jgi:DUF3043 family protein